MAVALGGDVARGRRTSHCVVRDGKFSHSDTFVVETFLRDNESIARPHGAHSVRGSVFLRVQSFPTADQFWSGLRIFGNTVIWHILPPARRPSAGLHQKTWNVSECVCWGKPTTVDETTRRSSARDFASEPSDRSKQTFEFSSVQDNDRPEAPSTWDYLQREQLSVRMLAILQAQYALAIFFFSYSIKLP